MLPIPPDQSLAVQQKSEDVSDH